MTEEYSTVLDSEARSSSINIRPAHGCDLPYIYGICLKTGDSGADASDLFNDPLLIGQYYAAPYFFYDISLCFVLTEDHIPAGYILAAADTRAFNEWMDKVWLAPLRLRYNPERSDSVAESQLIYLLHRRAPEFDPNFLSAYPAHLHIDLLPDQQGKGYGRRLMNMLCAALQERKVPGLHLGVGKRNCGAIAFYKRMEFNVIQEESWGLILGKSLQ